jgi:NhaP-type Na+/H+ or K+/H+ antiporter
MTFSHAFDDPALVLVTALSAGLIAQTVAHHLRIPGIVLLLGFGLLLGPDVLDVVRPMAVGEPLEALVGFAVAIILFEGGINLNLRRLRREGRSIRRLVTVGALVTWLGAAAAAALILGWAASQALLFGSLVIVTGPTVITPLLRRIRLHPRVSTVLEAEGVLIDPIGAIVAVVALEVALSPTGESVANAALQLLLNLGFGTLSGLAAGWLIALHLRAERLLPEGMENVVVLSIALFTYQLSNALVAESGIVAVTVAGITVGNVRTRALHDLKEFKEQLTVMLIGLMFVLLAADVRVENIRALGIPGLLTVGALMFVVRPLNVFLSTAGTEHTFREKAFLSWLAPRGIIAAAISSFFAQELGRAGIEGGEELQALVFMVIAVTVIVQGITGGPVASLLRLRRTTNSGFIVLGANPLGLLTGTVLSGAGQEVIFIDANPDACREAEDSGFKVIFGSGLSDRLLLRADPAGKTGCVAVTPNDALNLSFARRMKREFRVPAVWVALRYGHLSVTEEMVNSIGARVLFGQPRNLDLWSVRIEKQVGRLERWRRPPAKSREAETPRPDFNEARNFLLPLAWTRGKQTLPIDNEADLDRDSLWHFIVNRELEDKAEKWLGIHGWVREEPAP